MLFDTLNRFYVAEEAKDVAARFPRERAPWDSVRHMYEIGRAPENASHPEHALAGILAKGFWASLPYLDRTLLADVLERGRTPANTAAVDAALQTLDTEDSAPASAASPAATTAGRSTRRMRAGNETSL